MKIFIKEIYYLASNDLHILTIKFKDGKKILPGDELVCEDLPDLSFIVESLTIGTYNYDDDSFDIIIKKPNQPLPQYARRTFVKI